MRPTIEPTRVCRVSWMLAGVSGVAGHHPFGAGGEDLQMLAGEHAADGIDLVGDQAEFDRLVVEPGAEVEVEQHAGARQPQPVRQVARAAQHQPVLVEAQA